MPLLAVTIFLSAFLLFQVQPLIARFVLPWFGGGPAIWTACMLFFQIALLGGYAYAHALNRLLSPRRQVLCHLAVLATSLLFLPIIVSAAWKPTGAEPAGLYILAMLGVSIGGPYFALSATGPLLQSWFTRTMPQRAVYRLYGLSNAGSLLALLSYPFVFEPHLTRRAQSQTWSWAYALFVVCCAACAVGFWRSTTSPPPSPELTPSPLLHPKSQIPNPPLSPPTWPTFLIWAALACLGSVMLLATTNQMCQDVAVIPFLWVLPLSLYLLTFIICFDRPALYSRGWSVLLLVVGATGAVAALQRNVAIGLVPQVVIFSLTLLAACMICHGELVRRKPDPHYLTHFYLATAAGGAAGGVLVALVAPLVFNEFWEYPIALALCCALGALAARHDRAWLLFRRSPAIARGLTLACPAVLILFLGRDIFIDSGRIGTRLAAARNFYGVLRVFRTQREGGERIEMQQGHIIHGDQFTDARRRDWPTKYYGHDSGVGIALTQFPRRHAADGSPIGLRVGVIGMGAGTTAIYGHKGDDYRFYEINPRVVAMAHQYFTYLGDSPARQVIVMGDARITMERELDRGDAQHFDVLIVDAFTGDAIPIHLLTRECAALYFRELAPDGILALHISNHFLDLQPVATAMAADSGRRTELYQTPGDALERGTDPSLWMLITNNQAFLRATGTAHASAAQGKTIAWTDDFSSLWQVLATGQQ